MAVSFCNFLYCPYLSFLVALLSVQHPFVGTLFIFLIFFSSFSLFCISFNFNLFSPYEVFYLINYSIILDNPW